MARIVIETPCEHGRAEGCPFHDPACRSHSPCLATCCPGGSRRVLDPGEVLKGVYVAGSAIEPTRYATLQDVLDALAAGSEQTGGDL